MEQRIYQDSKVELTPLIARNYDSIMNTITLGKYSHFIHRAVRDMQLQTGESILDLGCGTGRNSMLMAGYLGDTGQVTGLDLSREMQVQFEKKIAGDPRLRFIRQRIDVPFQLDETFDRVLISFVIHGFPHEVREILLQNARNHLKPGGKLMILDFAEFSMEAMPSHHRFIFKTVECKYAFDYIGRDWKNILSGSGFGNFKEYLYIRNYARLLIGTNQAM